MIAMTVITIRHQIGQILQDADLPKMATGCPRVERGGIARMSIRTVETATQKHIK
jgi:hypothetical protein